eukprot:GABU01004766.1.p1 GENE.GABU01004766.1~~GABU01004766.1.p1  ORF type:complete len:229 (-),score=63.24 GABU01004766.1:188-802(-)
MMMQQMAAPRAEMMMQNIAPRAPSMANYDRADRRERRAAPRQQLRMQTESIQQDYVENEQYYDEALDDIANYNDGYQNAMVGGLPQAIERYRTLGVTNEYIEKQYFNNTTESISPNKFWSDYLTHITTKPDEPFLSEHFIYATSGLSEMLVVLALIDLPFEKGVHASESANNQLKLTAGSNCYLVCFSPRKSKRRETKSLILKS